MWHTVASSLRRPHRCRAAVVRLKCICLEIGGSLAVRRQQLSAVATQHHTQCVSICAIGEMFLTTLNKNKEIYKSIFVTICHSQTVLCLQIYPIHSHTRLQTVEIRAQIAVTALCTSFSFDIVTTQSVGKT